MMNFLLHRSLSLQILIFFMVVYCEPLPPAFLSKILPSSNGGHRAPSCVGIRLTAIMTPINPMKSLPLGGSTSVLVPYLKPTFIVFDNAYSSWVLNGSTQCSTCNCGLFFTTNHSLVVTNRYTMNFQRMESRLINSLLE